MRNHLHWSFYQDWFIFLVQMSILPMLGLPFQLVQAQTKINDIYTTKLIQLQPPFSVHVPFLSEPCQNSLYSKHPHIRAFFSGLRLVMFLFEGCLVRNPPESVLKMFLKLVSEIFQIIYY